MSFDEDREMGSSSFNESDEGYDLYIPPFNPTYEYYDEY